MAFCCANFLLYNIDALVARPVYMCETSPGSDEYEVCTFEVICESEPPIKYYIDWDDVDSLNNWVEQLDLTCVSDERIELMSKVYYLGEIVGCLLIARIPDLFGRKVPISTSITIQFFVYLTIILSRDIDLSTGLGFFMGVLHIGIYNGGYINVCEYVHTRWKNSACTVLLAFDMTTQIISAIYWRYISKNWLYL